MCIVFQCLLNVFQCLLLYANIVHAKQHLIFNYI